MGHNGAMESQDGSSHSWQKQKSHGRKQGGWGRGGCGRAEMSGDKERARGSPVPASLVDVSMVRPCAAPCPVSLVLLYAAQFLPLGHWARRMRPTAGSCGAQAGVTSEADWAGQGDMWG